MNRHKTLLPAAIATLALVLAGCGESAEDSGTPSGTAGGGGTLSATQTASDDVHNDADTTFAQMMIVHHEGAIQMADLAVKQADSEEVRALGEDISAAQGPEIEKMKSWLTAWGEDTASAGGAGGMDHGDMDMGSMEMDGMNQEEAMAELQTLSGADFDRRFLELMIAHHRGAVEMADAQLQDGRNPQALELAEQIIADQEAEISTMEQLLQNL
ncbi:DUF305 domain-containing protein [Ornithinimicrobium sp. Y1694]|uniref:DUF305 domain-containing protein n=1 Tax=Ornithinimicrobium sp. Y1694 TaxID=3418590 RepID=UPI003CE9A9E9